MHHRALSVRNVVPALARHEGGNNVEGASLRSARSTFFPLTGINVERAALDAARSTKFPPGYGLAAGAASPVEPSSLIPS